MQHTGCALAGRTDDDIRSDSSRRGSSPPDGWDILAMPDPDAALASDVEAVRSCHLSRRAWASRDGGTTSTPGRSSRSSARSAGRAHEWEATATVGNLGPCRR